METTELNAEIPASSDGKSVAGQTFIDGMAPPRIAELDEIGTEYRLKIAQRKAIQLEEAELKAALMEAMEDHDQFIYPIPDTEFQIELIRGKSNVKVSKRANE